MEFMRSEKGLTILEIIVSFLVLAILTVIYFPASKYVRDRALLAIMYTDIHDTRMAANLYNDDCGYYPPDVYRGVDPGLVEEFGWKKGQHSAVWETVSCTSWEGPYLKQWKRNPWGGLYDWDNYPSSYTAWGIPGGGVYLTLKPSTWGGKDGMPPPEFEQILEDQGVDVSKQKGVVAIYMGREPVWSVPGQPQ